MCSTYTVRTDTGGYSIRPPHCAAALNIPTGLGEVCGGHSEVVSAYNQYAGDWAGGAWVSGGSYTPSTGNILITHDSNGNRHTACVVSCDGDKIKTIAGGGSGIQHGSISVGSGRITGFVVPEW